MTDEPFRARAREAHKKHGGYMELAEQCNHVRSHSWWRNLIQYGAWGEIPGAGRVGPPPPEAIDGIAKVFDHKPYQVRALIAADWYQVYAEPSEPHLFGKALAETIRELEPKSRDAIRQLLIALPKRKPRQP